MSNWLDIALRVATLIMTTAVAIGVASINYRQLRLSREKLRLDLYNRRFDVYTRVLDMYGELLGWQRTEAQLALTNPFLKAVREAQFIFPQGSGVGEHLSEMSKRAFFIMRYDEVNHAIAGDRDTQVKLFTTREEHMTWLLPSMDKLEALMKPYISFEVL